MPYVHTDVQVFSGAVTNAWISVDLAPYIGTTGVFMAILAVRVHGVAGAPYFWVAPDGDAGDYFIDDTQCHGICFSYPDDAITTYSLTATKTSPAAKIQIRSKWNYTYTVYLIGFSEFVDKDVNVLNGAIPNIWTDVDISSEIGVSDNVLAMMKYVYSSGGDQRRSMRFNGDTKPLKTVVSP
jgi:hypothetical protein